MLREEIRSLQLALNMEPQVLLALAREVNGDARIRSLDDMLIEQLVALRNELNIIIQSSRMLQDLVAA